MILLWVSTQPDNSKLDLQAYLDGPELRPLRDMLTSRKPAPRVSPRTKRTSRTPTSWTHSSMRWLIYIYLFPSFGGRIECWSSRRPRRRWIRLFCPSTGCRSLEPGQSKWLWHKLCSHQTKKCRACRSCCVGELMLTVAHLGFHLLATDCDESLWGHDTAHVLVDGNVLCLSTTPISISHHGT